MGDTKILEGMRIADLAKRWNLAPHEMFAILEKAYPAAVGRDPLTHLAYLQAGEVISNCIIDGYVEGLKPYEKNCVESFISFSKNPAISRLVPSVVEIPICYQGALWYVSGTIAGDSGQPLHKDLAAESLAVLVDVNPLGRQINPDGTSTYSVLEQSALKLHLDVNSQGELMAEPPACDAAPGTP